MERKQPAIIAFGGVLVRILASDFEKRALIWIADLLLWVGQDGSG